MASIVRRPKAQIAQWNQFSADHLRDRGTQEAINGFHGHPAAFLNNRRLVTYPSDNVNTKLGCKFGTYRDGSVKKCLRGPSHSIPGQSHKRGAHTGFAIGHPTGLGPNYVKRRIGPTTGPPAARGAVREENEDEIEAALANRPKRNREADRLNTTLANTTTKRLKRRGG